VNGTCRKPTRSHVTLYPVIPCECGINSEKFHGLASQPLAVRKDILCHKFRKRAVAM